MAFPKIVALAALLLAGLPLYAQLPQPYGEIVRIESYRVHLRCEGHGGPTVILLHGTPRFSFHFSLVLPKAARMTRVCVYDRAGDAWSGSIAGQPSADLFVAELDRVARYLSPGAPVILAGHSVGGVLARAYFAVHPERVAAMVLIDTAPVDAVPIASVGPAIRKRPGIAPPFDKLPVRFHEAHLWATSKWLTYAAAVDPLQASEYQAGLYRMAAAAASATLPVWFLARASKSEGKEPWLETQRRMAAAWGNGKVVRVAPSGHDIELDQPDAVVRAIGDAVRSARANTQ